MFNIKLNPAIIIVLLGTIGLTAILSESSRQIGGKIPLALFFIFIIIVGIYILLKLKEEGNYEEFGGHGEFV